MDPETGGAAAVAVLGVLAAVAEAAPPPLPLVLPVPPLPRNSKIYFYEKLKSHKDFKRDFRGHSITAWTRGGGEGVKKCLFLSTLKV